MKNIKCRKCGKDATYKAETIFGQWYFCERHIKKYRNNMCVRNVIKLTK